LPKIYAKGALDNVAQTKSRKPREQHEQLEFAAGTKVERFALFAHFAEQEINTWTATN
jgi:hypothetical protein